MYQITYTQAALEDLQWFRKQEQATILDGIDANLQYEPTRTTRNRKPMRTNPIATWELRLGDFRVLYNVGEAVSIVEIQRIGEKRGSQFLFRGKGENL
ncbi:type II toxin-antitoxin system RelE family toxin [Prochlorothrix hollandica]|uniref:Plasmid stabilization system protein, RelE/ParE famil n=1 Tax=Prochlorothrix hollandica PCC 9006 = CALU 1027 TaxID=317619 RepID=A0A0M2Q160_PROHO|nr:hypothetical protein [Prochlorothrix hollandica]KKJ00699.1 plasmid stabilization system protein, RelE/ParE famil [Prochlorothrix hollandica PCC 9006 = CALU 1027]